jgi:flagellar biosynthesis/type III secretory pathway protein FliH
MTPDQHPQPAPQPARSSDTPRQGTSHSGDGPKRRGRPKGLSPAEQARRAREQAERLAARADELERRAAEAEERRREQAAAQARREAKRQASEEKKQGKSTRDRRMVLGTAVDQLLTDWMDEVNRGDENAQRNFSALMRLIAERVHESRSRRLLGLIPLPDGKASGPSTS